MEKELVLKIVEKIAERLETEMKIWDDMKKVNEKFDDENHVEVVEICIGEITKRKNQIEILSEAIGKIILNMEE